MENFNNFITDVRTLGVRTLQQSAFKNPSSHALTRDLPKFCVCDLVIFVRMRQRDNLNSRVFCRSLLQPKLKLRILCILGSRINVQRFFAYLFIRGLVHEKNALVGAPPTNLQSSSMFVHDKESESGCTGPIF